MFEAIRVILLENLMVVDLVDFHLVEGPQHHDLLLKNLVFLDGCHSWRVMLLVAHNDVRDQRAFGWEESSAGLQRHHMPHLRVLKVILS